MNRSDIERHIKIEKNAACKASSAVAFAIGVALLSHCEDNISLKIDFQQECLLCCAVDADTKFQTNVVIDRWYIVPFGYKKTY